jgi:large subunit ribosomal protein L28
MAQRCQVCGRGPRAGNSISHAHNVTKRRFLPNLQKVRVRVGGRVVRQRVCTRCIRSGRIQKASRGGSGASSA